MIQYKDLSALITDTSPGKVKRERFTGSIVLDGLRSHLQTGGYASVLEDIDDFDTVDIANIAGCHQFIELVKEEVEKNNKVHNTMIQK